MGGPLVLERAKPGQIVPVDSEHSALAQCLRGGTAAEVRRLVLTASGGPFRGRTRDELLDVTVDQALAHPTWDMGPVVTINSATLVNKGLEVIEAHLLFGIPYDRIEVVVHPTSVVHSMVEFVDGSTLAQASPPTMLIPIALGLAWPDRVPDTAPPVDWTRSNTWEFFPLDDEAFPAVALARRGRHGGRHRAGGLQRRERGRGRGVPARPARVRRDHRHGFPRPGAPRRTLERALTLDDVLAADAWARDEAAPQIERPMSTHDRLSLLYPARGASLFAVAILASIGLHEFGHMIPAKVFGGKVTQYFIGFGPTVWSRQNGETEYGVKAIPLGGYVKIVGHAAAGQGARRQGRVRRRRQPRRHGPQVQHRPVRPADLRRPRRRVGDHHRRRRGPALLPAWPGGRRSS